MITGTFNTIPKTKNSHGYGWARTWAENLDVEINHAGDPVETLYLDHGVNFGGGLNLFGGYDDKLHNRILNFMEAKEIYSLDIDMPEYGEMLKGRKDVREGGHEKLMDQLTEKLKTAEKVKSTDLEFEWLAVGDSHTAAYAPKNSAVIRTNGLTLNGQIQENFEYVKSHINEMNSCKGVTLSFGNIDVRHHIIRLGVDWKSMFAKYKMFGDSLDCDVEYATPWPIEHEERKLPQTGFYKKQPFWGTREERSTLVNDIIKYMEDNDMKRVEYPMRWLEMNPEQYAKDKMERLSSVHISPESYRRKDWGEEAGLEAFF